MQLNPHALRLATPHSERGVSDPHDERIAAGTRLGEDLNVLAVHEAQLKETPLECREGRCTGADAHDGAPGARRQGREAHKARRAAQTFRDSDGVHTGQYG